MFNTKPKVYHVFLLSTRAGGLGINLATADTVSLAARQKPHPTADLCTYWSKASLIYGSPSLARLAATGRGTERYGCGHAGAMQHSAHGFCAPSGSACGKSTHTSCLPCYPMLHLQKLPRFPVRVLHALCWPACACRPCVHFPESFVPPSCKPMPIAPKHATTIATWPGNPAGHAQPLKIPNPEPCRW